MYHNPESPEIPQNLDDLIIALSAQESTTYNRLLRSIKLQPNDFEAYSYWLADRYTRNCIIDTEKFQLMLLCWEEGHKTPIHDHDGEECWVKVIEGELKEIIYKNNEKDELVAVKSSISKANQVTYMKDFMGFHSLENVSNTRSMTLHLYAKPIRKCNIFNENSKAFEETKLSYHTTA